ncbi:hypothetical protein A4A49_65716, partial [Nicotiana attenuata]
EFTSTNFHHGGTFTFGPFPKYIGERNVVAFSIDKDTFSVVELCSYTKDLGYVSVGGLFHFDSKSSKFVRLNSDSQLLELISDLKNGDILDIYVQHEIDNPEVADVGLVVGSDVAETDSIYVSGPVVGSRDTTSEPFYIESGPRWNLGYLEDIGIVEGADIYGAELEELSALPEEDDTDGDDELRAFRDERRSKKAAKYAQFNEKRKDAINDEQRRKKIADAEEVILGEAGIDRGFEDIGK